VVGLRSRWAAVSRRDRGIALAGIVVAVAIAFIAVGVLAATGSSTAVAVVSPSPAAVQTGAPSGPASTAAAPPSVAAPSAEPTPQTADPLLGTDGRLTVLLLGSDYRPAKPGNRTDAIMVVSVDPSTGKSAAFSVPRDTERFPLPGGDTFNPKVNALFQSLQTQTGHGGAAMSQAVAAAFDIEIDGFVFIGFRGVRELVGAVGGVDVTLDKAYYDPEYWVSAKKQGWGLPAGTSHLGPEDALIFSRSRKGDNDFARARRQQLLVMAALKKTRSLGPTALPRLLSIASKTVATDLPLDRAADLYRIVASTDLGTVPRTVFGPTKYASSIGGSSFALNMAACRKWIEANFPPERPFAAWPNTASMGTRLTP
jgi:polyisoprenyl-teichoic acid--peptidoglycan teichoic acid transferase